MSECVCVVFVVVELETLKPGVSETTACGRAAHTRDKKMGTRSTGDGDGKK